MKLLNHVNIANIRPELVLGLVICDSVFQRITPFPMVVTSITDGIHMKGSLHYVGAAADLRLPKGYSLSSNTHKTCVDLLKLSLGRHYDVVLETSHIHVEYDPKNNRHLNIVDALT